MNIRRINCQIASLLGSATLLIALCGAMLAFAQAPCEQIKAACTKAGFVQGGASSGTGLWRDCVEPILQGRAHPKKATKPLAKVDPLVVAACKAQNPNFGPGGQKGGAGTTFVAPLSSLPATQPRIFASSREHPNIVFVLTDDLAMNLVQYMPNVLDMEKRGVTFANYFVTDSLCCPSRSSIFTGCFPHNTGIFRNEGDDGGYQGYVVRGHENNNVATALWVAGYRTAMLGKYLNGYEPSRHPRAAGWNFWRVAGNGYGGFNYALNEDGKVVRYAHAPADYLTDVVSQQATRFIRESKGHPFVIEVATFAPHAPYIPAPRDAGAFPGLRAPQTPAFGAAPGPNAPRWLARQPALTEADKAQIDEAFRKRAQSVLAVDAMIGALQAAVAEIGQENNTYFVFSSDNGYHMGDYRLMPGKMTAFDTDINVPLVVTGPDVPAGVKLNEIVENIDLNPTFLELTGVGANANADGHSLASLLSGQTAGDWRTSALIEHHGPRHEPDDPDAPAVRSGNPPTYEAMRTAAALYVEYEDGDREYHELASDPYELNNTYNSLSEAQRAALHSALAAMQSCKGGASCWAAQHAAVPQGKPGAR